MKVEIIKSFKTTRGEVKKGEVLEVTPFAAGKWIKDGLAKEVK